MKWLIFAFLVACAPPIGQVEQPVIEPINYRGDQLDPVLKAGTEIQFQLYTTTVTSADGLSYQYRTMFFYGANEAQQLWPYVDASKNLFFYKDGTTDPRLAVTGMWFAGNAAEIAP